MSKGLDSLRYIAYSVNEVYDDFEEDFGDDIDIIEKELKALEIIKKLPSDYIKDLLDFIRSFKDDDFGDFISWGGDETPILIKEEEYNLLKEVFL